MESPNSTTSFELSQYNLADSKFFGDAIVSSNNGHLVFFNKQGDVINEHEDVAANWIYAVPEEGLIVVGNAHYELRKICVDSNYDVVSNDVLFQSQYLMIDPTIMKLEDGTWIMSYVEIQGTVNNADPNCENGLYTVHTYASKDLVNWEQGSDIISENNNIEDGDMFENNGRIYYLYEKETLDKSSSDICMKYSEDRCMSWSDETIIIPADGDNEMASVIIENEKINIYYSSDLSNPGMSYDGASVYKAQYDLDFNNPKIGEKVDISESEGILLYDMHMEDESVYYLYSRNYLTENILVLK